MGLEGVEFRIYVSCCSDVVGHEKESFVAEIGKLVVAPEER